MNTQCSRGLTGALAACLFGITGAPAYAGDAAELNVLGFSPEGKIFAFEEYGVQDGSGFPYANRFYIDTATDRFVPGSPVRIRLDDEQATEQDARDKAAALGQNIIADSTLTYDHLAAFNPLTEESADPHRLVANPAPVFPPIAASIGLRLEEISLPVPSGCAGVAGPIKGFKLVQFAPATNTDLKTLHTDKSIPSSRNCPLGYRLTGLYIKLGPDAASGQFALVIAVRSVGFEGPDHRYIAVPGQL